MFKIIGSVDVLLNVSARTLHLLLMNENWNFSLSRVLPQ